VGEEEEEEEEEEEVSSHERDAYLKGSDMTVRECYRRPVEMACGRRLLAASRLGT